MLQNNDSDDFRMTLHWTATEMCGDNGGFIREFPAGVLFNFFYIEMLCRVIRWFFRFLGFSFSLPLALLPFPARLFLELFSAYRVIVVWLDSFFPSFLFLLS